MSQQQKGIFDDWKLKFNITCNLCLIHQRGIVIVLRDQWGKQALGGVPTALALALMVLWATFTHDPFMWAWAALWVCCYLKRRVEAAKLAKKGWHTQCEGRSKDGRRFGFSERFAKRWIEPLLVGLLGGIAYWLYEQHGWRPTGLPYFLLCGVFTLPLVESVQRTIWNRRVEAMNDARLEQLTAIRDFQDRYGNF